MTQPDQTQEANPTPHKVAAMVSVQIDPDKWDYHFTDDYTNMNAVIARANEELAPIGVEITLMGSVTQ